MNLHALLLHFVEIEQLIDEQEQPLGITVDNRKGLRNNKKGVQSDNTTIKHFFEYNYEKSDKTKDASYLNSVIESESGNPISAFF